MKASWFWFAAAVGTLAALIARSAQASDLHSTAVEKPSAGGRVGMHTVRAGETLAGIAKTYYNEQALWPALWDANRAKLSSPDLLSVGVMLIVPAPLDPLKLDAYRRRAREHAAIWEAWVAAGKRGMPTLPASVLNQS